jgi:hypothetical protein
MRTNDPSRNSRNTAHKHHSSPTFLLHVGDAQLRQEICRSAVDTPCFLKILNRDLIDGLDARVTTCRARVIDEDGGLAECRHDLGVELADLSMLP